MVKIVRYFQVSRKSTSNDNISSIERYLQIKAFLLFYIMKAVQPDMLLSVVEYLLATLTKATLPVLTTNGS